VIVTVVVTLVAAALTIAAFFADTWWVLDVLTSYRPQAVGVLAAAAVALALLRCWRVLAVAVIALALNVGQVAPVYTDHQPDALADSPTLSIAHVNLQSSMGDIPAITDWLTGHPADVVVIFDTNRVLIDTVTRGVDGYRMIYPRLAGINTDTKGRQTTRLDPPSSELVVVTDRDDITADVPHHPGLLDAAVELHTAIGGQIVTMLGLHTESPTNAVRHATRDRQLDAVASWLQAATDPAIAFGDFNITYFSPTFRRLLEQSGTRSSQLGFGVQATWPAGFRPVGVGIDQSIYKGPITVVARRRGPVLGSEHRVLIVTYALASP